MKIKFDWDEDKAYVGFYKGIPYCISEYRKFVERYMEDHRKCDEYEVGIYNVDSLFVISRHDLFLYEYNDLYITERDIIMSKLFMEDVSTTIRKTYNSLAELARLVGQTKKGKKLMKELLSSLDTLSDIGKDDKLVEELQVISEVDNPFIYSPIKEYNGYVSKYEEYINFRNYWDDCD